MPQFIRNVRTQVGKVVVGQDTMVERTLIALLTGGHLLLQGMPGLAKTLLVNTISKAIDLQSSRVQFTIDMLPSDIVGTEILDQRTSEFKTIKGPIFTNLLLADEINRATPKVQSALLEAMQERKVTIGGQTYRLPAPFLVIATQNPIEQSGTFELPEAQLDRFMMCHRLDYPTESEELSILNQQMNLVIKRTEDGGAIPQSAFDMVEDTKAESLSSLVDAMEAVQKVHVSETFLQKCVELTRQTRVHPDLELGCSPRAGIALITASRARAYINDRDYVIPEDMYALAEDVILHRLRANYEAVAEGRSAATALNEILSGLA